MTTIPVATSPSVLRSVKRGDLQQITALAQQAQWPTWILEDLPRLLKARRTCCWVAERSGRIVGFAIGSIRRPASEGLGFGRLLLSIVGHVLGSQHRRVLVDMFDVAVEPAWQASGVERELLARLYERLRGQADRLRIIVPESSLAAQVFLHEAGYKAVRVLRCYYGDQDGYLMRCLPVPA